MKMQIDLYRTGYHKGLSGERRKNTTIYDGKSRKLLPEKVSFPLDVCESKTDQRVSDKSLLFVPQDGRERALRCEEILTYPGNGAQKDVCSIPIVKHGGSWYFREDWIPHWHLIVTAQSV